MIDIEIDHDFLGLGGIDAGGGIEAALDGREDQVERRAPPLVQREEPQAHRLGGRDRDRDDAAARRVVAMRSGDIDVIVEPAAGQLTATYPVGVGQDRTPTPGGTFYTKELLQPTNRGGPYGTFAYGLSGFSNTLTSFAGSDGVVGIHGTDQPDTVGTDVSAGCIRMNNADINELARRLPLGVPVEIVA